MKNKPTKQGEFINWHNVPISSVEKVDVKSDHGKKETVARILRMSNGKGYNFRKPGFLQTEKTILIVGVTGRP